jgi:hypothetical protein
VSVDPREHASKRMDAWWSGLRIAAEHWLLIPFFKELTHVFSGVLWPAAGLSSLAKWSAPGQGTARMDAAPSAIIVLSGVLS